MRSAHPFMSLAVGVVALSATASVTHAAEPNPAAILRAAKLAAGGDAMDRRTGAYERGVHGDTRYETWLDLRRYAMKSTSVRDGVVRTSGFNGREQWSVKGDGAVSIKTDEASLKEAVTTAYFSNGGYFFPERFSARLRYLSMAREGATAFDVIEAEPQGGRAAELWFDRRTHLLARIVDRAGSPPVSVTVSDWRRVGPARVAFHGVVATLDGHVLETQQVDSTEDRDLPPSTFDPPAAMTRPPPPHG